MKKRKSIKLKWILISLLLGGFSLFVGWSLWTTFLFFKMKIGLSGILKGLGILFGIMLCFMLWGGTGGGGSLGGGWDI